LYELLVLFVEGKNAGVNTYASYFKCASSKGFASHLLLDLIEELLDVLELELLMPQSLEEII